MEAVTRYLVNVESVNETNRWGYFSLDAYGMHRVGFDSLSEQPLINLRWQRDHATITGPIDLSKAIRLTPQLLADKYVIRRFKSMDMINTLFVRVLDSWVQCRGINVLGGQPGQLLDCRENTAPGMQCMITLNPDGQPCMAQNIGFFSLASNRCVKIHGFAGVTPQTNLWMYNSHGRLMFEIMREYSGWIMHFDDYWLAEPEFVDALEQANAFGSLFVRAIDGDGHNCWVQCPEVRIAGFPVPIID